MSPTHAQPVSSTPEHSAEHHRRRWYALLILSLSLMLVIMDSTIVNVAIPSIVRNFDATFRDAEWVNTIYSLVYAATLILWGKIGDQYGRRLLFLIGVALFGLGSALVGASSSITMLIAMRALQGIGAAILSPSTLSIVTTTFRGKERGIAFGVWGATAGVAAALGPLLGGWVIDHATWMVDDFGSWRWAFYINIPIVIAAFFGSLWAIRESRDEHTRHYFDFLGTVVGGLGLAAVVFGIIEGQGYGWWKPSDVFTIFGWEWPSQSISIVPISILVGVILLAIFTWYERRLERRGTEPLFEFGLLRFRSFRYGMITGLIVNLGEIGILFAITLFLQGTKGLSAFDTGVALLPLAAMAFVGAPLAGAFSQRLGPKWIVTTGMVLEVLALLALSITITPDVSITSVAILLGLYGLGLGLAIAQLTNLVLYDIPTAKSGIASGGNSTIRQVGAALGIAIIGMVLTTSIERNLDDEFQASDLPPQVIAMQNVYLEMAKQPVSFDFEAMLAAGAPPGMGGTSASAAGGEMPAHPGAEEAPPGLGGSDPAAAPPPGMPSPDELRAQGRKLGDIVEAARSEGMSTAALVAAIFVGMGALSSLLLPNPKEAPEERVPGKRDTVAQ